MSQYCFKHPTGKDVFLFKLINKNETEIHISNYGAIVNAFKIKMADKSYIDIVPGFDKMEDYITPYYLNNCPLFNAAMGRYGNRIKNAKIVIDGLTYELTKNKVNDHLHGGNEGFDKKVWEVVDYSSKSLYLQYKSADGEEGYPGQLTTNIRFELSDDDELSYEYTATTDKPTAVNLSHHLYFNLDDKDGTINNHSVRLPADYILEQDDSFVVTGTLIEVENTGFDFRQWKKISADVDPVLGYDQTYSNKKTNFEMTLMAEAMSSANKIKLQVYSTSPIIHFYTGRWIPELTGKNNRVYNPFSALSFETQIHPNAINIPHFPNTILRPEQTHHQKTLYKIIVEN